MVCASRGTNGMPRRQPGRSSAKAVLERMGTARRAVNSQEGLGLLVHSGGRETRDAPALSLCRKPRGQASCSSDPTTVPASAGFSILTAAAATPQSGSRSESAARRDFKSRLACTAKRLARKAKPCESLAHIVPESATVSSQVQSCN